MPRNVLIILAGGFTQMVNGSQSHLVSSSPTDMAFALAALTLDLGFHVLSATYTPYAARIAAALQQGDAQLNQDAAQLQ